MDRDVNDALLADRLEAPVADAAPAAWRSVLRLAWPVAVQNSLIAVVSLYDRWLVSWLPGGAAASAAQTTATYLAWFLLSYTMLVTVGSATLVAYLVGAGDRRTARQVLHQSLGLAFFLGMLGSAVGLIVLEPVLRLLRLDGEAVVYAAAYLRPLLLSLSLQMVCHAGIACLSGAGDTRTGLVVLGGVAVVNVPLAPAFCFGFGPIPALGFPGIATGTAVSQALGAVVVLAILWRGRAGLRLRLRYVRPRPALLGRLLRVSVPAALDNLSMQVGYLWFLGIVNGLGNDAAAAHGHALAWEGLSYMLGSAFGTAAVTVVGQNKGAGRPDLASRGGWTAFGLGAGVMCAVGVIYFALATPMLTVFCPQPEQQSVVEEGVPVLRLIAFGMPALASCMILAAALRGAGDTRVPVLFTLAGFFAVRIPLAYLLTGPLGLRGAWLAMLADLHVRGLFVLWRFASGRWRSVRV